MLLKIISICLFKPVTMQLLKWQICHREDFTDSLWGFISLVAWIEDVFVDHTVS